MYVGISSYVAKFNDCTGVDDNKLNKKIKVYLVGTNGLNLD